MTQITLTTLCKDTDGILVEKQNEGLHRLSPL